MTEDQQQSEILLTNLPELPPFDTWRNKTFNEVSQDFLDIYNSPIKFLKESGKIGLSGIGNYAGVMAIFIGINFLLFVYSIFHLIYHGFDLDQLKYIFVVLLLCILFSVFVSIKTYRYVLVAGLKKVYANLKPLLFKMCELIINQAEKLLMQPQALTDERVRRAIDYTRIVNDYFTKLPRLLKKALIFLLKRIPLFPMLIPLKKEIEEGRKEEAAMMLYENINRGLNDFFDSNSFKWIYWLLPLNLIAVIGVIAYTLS